MPMGNCCPQAFAGLLHIVTHMVSCVGPLLLGTICCRLCCDTFSLYAKVPLVWMLAVVMGGIHCTIMCIGRCLAHLDVFAIKRMLVCYVSALTQLVKHVGITAAPAVMSVWLPHHKACADLHVTEQSHDSAACLFSFHKAMTVSLAASAATQQDNMLKSFALCISDDCWGVVMNSTLGAMALAHAQMVQSDAEVL